MVKKETKKSPAAHGGAEERYFEGIGRRKTAVARVRLVAGAGKIVVNKKELTDYFRLPKLAETARSPFEHLKLGGRFNVSANVEGGGVNAQAEAVRHGISRALVVWDQEFKKRLRGAGYLTRDSRMVERKKYGLKKARRAPQWQKR